MRWVAIVVTVVPPVLHPGRAAAGELTVVSVEPAMNGLTAPINTGVTIHFDRPIDRATVGNDSFWAFGRWSGTSFGTYSFSDGDQTVTLNPDGDFSAGEQAMVIYAYEESIFLNVHATHETDQDKLEAHFIIPDQEALEAEHRKEVEA